MEDTSSKTVRLTCIKEKGKLRARILSQGYLKTANCQFPRNIRKEGCEYIVSSTNISLKKGPRGKYYYSIRSKKIDIVSLENNTDGSVRPEKIYGDDEDPICIICMDAPKTLVFVPCGHYCVCSECSERLKECPLCREGITCAVNRDLLE
jgi:hypothetical protein